MDHRTHSRRKSGLNVLRTLSIAGALAAALAATAGPAAAQADDVVLAAGVPKSVYRHAGVQAAACGPEAMRDTVRRLVRALTANQADDAFATTAPAIRQKFRDPRQFVVAIARFQTPLYKARNILFDGIDRSGGRPVVRAFIDVGKNRRWLATFEMEPQADGAWKILDVGLSAAPGHVI